MAPDFLRDHLQLTGDQTISVWIKIDTDSALGYIISSNGGPNRVLACTPSYLEVSNASDTGGTNIHYYWVPDPEVFYHIVTKYDKTLGKVELFVDGNLVAEQLKTPDFLRILADPWYLGSRNGSARFFKGVIDDVRLYNRALSQEEILYLYQKESRINSDSDNDGTNDDLDGCPNDSNKIEPGICGCGMPETDTNSDGEPNCIDDDDDGDGMPDEWEHTYEGLNPLFDDSADDLDGDGFSNLAEFENGSLPNDLNSIPNQPPTVPLLSLPTNNALDIDPLNTILKWKPSNDPEGDAVEYCGSIKEDGSPDDIPIYLGCDKNQFKTESFLNLSTIPLTLEPGKTYLWAIWAIDKKGNWSEASEWWQFETDSSIPPKIEIEATLPMGEPDKVYLTQDQKPVFIKGTGSSEPYSWSVARGNLPDGLEINQLTGEISGTPTLSGDYGFTVLAEDSNGHIATKELHINIRTILKPQQEKTAKRYALIVAPTYPDSEVDNVTPAYKFEQYLKSEPRWKFDKVLSLGTEHVNWDTLKRKLDEILELLVEGDHFLFFYCGHGATGENGKKEEGFVKKYPKFIRVTGMEHPQFAGFLDVPTNGDEALCLPEPYSDVCNPIFDDDLPSYFLAQENKEKWAKINKHFFFNSCYSGGFWGRGGEDEGDLERLEKIAFVASTPEAYLSTPTVLWEKIKEAVKQQNFNYTFEALYRYLNESSGPVVYQDYVAAGPEETNGYIFKFTQYPVTYNDILIEDVHPVKIADLNADGCVDLTDYSIIISEIRNNDPQNSLNDLNGDGLVNISDARYLVTQFTNPRGAACQ